MKPNTMKAIFVFCGLIVLASSLGIDMWQRTDDGGVYLINTQQEYNWFEALHECARRNMSLLTMDTVYRYQQIKKLFDKICVNWEPRLWLAGHDNAIQNRYEWFTTGQAFHFTNWMKGEPNNGQEHCVMIWTKAVEWNDEGCSRKHGYICEEMPLLKEKSKEFNALKKSYESDISQLKAELGSWKKLGLTQTNRTAATNNYSLIFHNN